MNEPVKNDSEGSATADARELVAAHALGATDSVEVAAVLRLIESDAAAAADLASYDTLAEALLFAAAPVEPPPALEARLRASLQALPALETPRVPWQVRLARWFAPPTWPAWGVAAAAVALLLVSNISWGLSLRHARQEAAKVAAMQQEQAAMMALMTSDTMQKTMLPASEQSADGKAWAELRWDPTQNMALLTVGGFPALGEDQTYQLWLVRGDERMSGGTFQVNDRGWARVMVHSPEPLEMFEAVGVTPEPMGGSPGPTAPPVVRGPLEG